MSDYSLDALGKEFGIGGRRHADSAACPLALGALFMEQLFGGYP
jgi:DNA polymerase III epsilon subunit-like protein